jgi:dihydroxyacetone kinase
MRRFLIVGALLLAGCGGEASSAGDFEGEQRAVADAVEEIQTAAQRRDGEALCRDLLAKALRDRAAQAGSSCDKEIEKAVEDADSLDLDVEKVSISGTTAQVTVGGDAGEDRRKATIEMVKEEGRWRAASFSVAGS